MSRRRAALVIACAIVMAAAIAWGLSHPSPARCEVTDVIRGTVDKFRPGILSLTDVRLPDGGNAGRPVMVIVNKDTEYFDGPIKTTKESVTKGLKVLVKCEPAGTGRIALLVRIVGGKAP
ncbi:MAG TPA: hypothetical protein VF827_07715 [Syntrophales bacterium]